MSGSPITGRSVLPTAVVIVLLLLAGLGVAERSGELVSNFVDSLTGDAEDTRPEGPPEDDQDDTSDPEPGDGEDPGEEDNQVAEEPDAGNAASPSGSAECVAPVLPAQPDEAVVLAEGCTEVVVRPDEERVVDGDAIVREGGNQPPACAAFGSHYSWQVTDEPAANVEFTAVRQGARYHLAEGPKGDVSGMCGRVSIVNPSSSAAALHLRYVLLDCQPTGQAC